MRLSTILAIVAAIAFAAAQPLAAQQSLRQKEALQTDGVERIAFHVPGATGMLELPRRRAEDRLPAVLVLHDALGTDGRSDPYAENLLGTDIGVLELLELEDGSLPAVLAALAAHPRIDAAKLGVLGFGAGARLAAMFPRASVVRVLLYPGCATLPEADASSGPVLLMHGDGDPFNTVETCTRAAQLLGATGTIVQHTIYAGASYAWDYPQFGLDAPTLLPAAGTALRVRVRPAPELRVVSATEVAEFFASTFAAGVP